MPWTTTARTTRRRFAAVGAWVLAGVVVHGTRADSSHPSAHSGTVSPSNPAMANVPKGRTIPALRRVDSSLDGRDPLANSLRNPQIDLATPLDFRDLYAVEGRDDVYVRRSGAVYAVFPRTYYVKQKKKEVTRVPGGTTYSIGFPSTLKVAPGRGGRDSLGERVDHAIDSSVGGLERPSRLEQRVVPAPVSSTPTEAVVAPPPAADVLPRFVVNESYRRARIDAMLRAAGE